MVCGDYTVMNWQSSVETAGQQLTPHEQHHTLKLHLSEMRTPSMLWIWPREIASQLDKEKQGIFFPPYLMTEESDNIVFLLSKYMMIKLCTTRSTRFIFLFSVRKKMRERIWFELYEGIKTFKILPIPFCQVPLLLNRFLNDISKFCLHSYFRTINWMKFFFNR